MREFIHRLTWVNVWVVMLAMGWLLPNHYQPWITFHTDAWIAWVLVLAGAGAVIRNRDQVEWTGLMMVAAIVTVIPFSQYAAGLLVFSGQAWVSTAYLMGFLASLILGYRWEKKNPDQSMNAVFTAICLACLVSVGMQLYQWLSIDGLALWIAYMADNRPFANLIQPNQLATFLFWGLVSIGWFAHHKKISSPTAVLMAMFFLVGIVLTRSRTTTAAIGLSMLAAWHWRAVWWTKARFRICIGLLLFFVACQFAVGPLSTALLLDKPFNDIARVAGAGIRLDAYKLFADAVFQRPFFGYGWSNLSSAQILVAENHVEMAGTLQHAHNLFLDLVLWTGLPIGLFLSSILLIWFYRAFKRVSTIDDALLLLFVGAFWWHAMLELPHQYAYMLLPVGLVMGIQDARSRQSIWFRSSHLSFTALWLAATALLALITHDYLRMEADFQALRFERSYGMQQPPEAPKTLVLSHLEALVKMGRLIPRSGMSQEELNWMKQTANFFPSPANQYTYTAALAMNGRPDLAQRQMRILQKMMITADYEALGKIWLNQSSVNAQFIQTKWLLKAAE